jgi:hypothetical protein
VLRSSHLQVRKVNRASNQLESTCSLQCSWGHGHTTDTAAATSPIQSSTLLLALASTVVLGFEAHRDPWPHFCSFQIFTCFEMGPPLWREEVYDYYWSFLSLLGSDCAASHSLTHSINHYDSFPQLTNQGFSPLQTWVVGPWSKSLQGLTDRYAAFVLKATRSK